MPALAETYVQGVDAEEPALAKAGVKVITEELCGHSFSGSAISAINLRLDAGLAICRPCLGRSLPLSDPRRTLRAGREAGMITSQAALIAIGIDWDGRRQVLVEIANRESRSISAGFSAAAQGARSPWRRICCRR